MSRDVGGRSPEVPTGSPGDSPARGPGGVAVLALAALVVSGVPGTAQETGQDQPGWLGVGILQGALCDSMPEGWRDDVQRIREQCRQIVLVDAVIDGSPAEEAGIQPGDTLVAVDGRDLERRSGRRALISLQPGEPVQIVVGRSEGRVSLEAVPEPRPPRAGPVPVRIADSVHPRAPALVRPRVLAAPDPPESWDGDAPPVEVVGTDGGEMAGIRVTEDGSVYLVRQQGESVLVRRLRDLAPQVRAMQDSVLAEARERIRALRERQRAARESLEDVEMDRDELAASTGRLRAAGAEFRTLERSLAEYFPGVERGLLVLQVVPGTPAASLGLRAGDVVVRAAGRAVAGPADLRSALSEYASRDSVQITWVRRGEEKSGALTHR